MTDHNYFDPGLAPSEVWCQHCGETIIDLRTSPSGWCDECLVAYVQEAARRRHQKEAAMDPFLLEGQKYGDLPLDCSSPIKEPSV